jgi:hypothetical protein
LEWDVSLLFELEFHLFRPMTNRLHSCERGTVNEATFAVDVALVQGFKVKSGSDVITGFLIANECKATSGALRRGGASGDII